MEQADSIAMFGEEYDSIATFSSRTVAVASLWILEGSSSSLMSRATRKLLAQRI